MLRSANEGPIVFFILRAPPFAPPYYSVTIPLEGHHCLEICRPKSLLHLLRTTRPGRRPWFCTSKILSRTSLSPTCNISSVSGLGGIPASSLLAADHFRGFWRLRLPLFQPIQSALFAPRLCMFLLRVLVAGVVGDSLCHNRSSKRAASVGDLLKVFPVFANLVRKETRGLFGLVRFRRPLKRVVSRGVPPVRDHVGSPDRKPSKSKSRSKAPATIQERA